MRDNTVADMEAIVDLHGLLLLAGKCDKQMSEILVWLEVALEDQTGHDAGLPSIRRIKSAPSLVYNGGMAALACLAGKSTPIERVASDIVAQVVHMESPSPRGAAGKGMSQWDLNEADRQRAEAVMAAQARRLKATLPRPQYERVLEQRRYEQLHRRLEQEVPAIRYHLAMAAEG